MNEKKMNAEERLQTIEQILQATNNDELRSVRAPFMVWGIASTIMGAITYLATSRLTGEWWNSLWLLLFLVPIIPAARGKISILHSTTYLEENISKVTGTLGALFFGIFIAFLCFFLIEQVSLFQLMCPLAVLFVSYTLMQVWWLAKRWGLFIFSLMGLMCGVLLMCWVVMTLPQFKPVYHLVTGLLLGLLYLIPAVLYKNKTKS